MLGLGILLLLIPTYVDLERVVWASDDQGHGPIIIAVAAWLLWRLRERLFALPVAPSNVGGGILLASALAIYALGRSQSIVQLEAGSHILILAAALLLWRGPAALKMAWFPLFFLIFMVPLPGVFVQAMTVPLKSAVSYVAEALLHSFNYPVARAGVVIQVGQYQLLVADACAGLNSMFTLESLGLLYMNIVSHASRWRNILLAILIIPISFVANVVRVVILILVTYHFGDAAGQGFVHGFAGMVLFLVALTLILAVDTLLGRFDAASLTKRQGAVHA
ncbi:exosortase B [Pelomonas sp. Root1217]|uniref:exosortase B n=1 Tax=Pelomonas sp. Root1217 TaxID=1736430 RepID=UPI0009E89076|nr:exosortase B [Pelomonas sp. Root1217]